jgi:hypothetical protein
MPVAVHVPHGGQTELTSGLLLQMLEALHDTKRSPEYFV